jgi:hypothetical protein
VLAWSPGRNLPRPILTAAASVGWARHFSSVASFAFSASPRELHIARVVLAGLRHAHGEAPLRGEGPERRSVLRACSWPTWCKRGADLCGTPSTLGPATRRDPATGGKRQPLHWLARAQTPCSSSTTDQQTGLCKRRHSSPGVRSGPGSHRRSGQDAPARVPSPPSPSRLAGNGRHARSAHSRLLRRGL